MATKVKASLRFKGRQMAHRDLGYKIINRLFMDIGEAGTVEFMPRMEGTTLHANLAPAKKAEVQQPPSAPKPKPACVRCCTFGGSRGIGDLQAKAITA